MAPGPRSESVVSAGVEHARQGRFLALVTLNSSTLTWAWLRNTHGSPVRSAMFHGVRSTDGSRWWLYSEWYCMTGAKQAAAAERT
jgi:hypothetical protein